MIPVLKLNNQSERTMNTEQQRIAIAEACGWKWERLWTGELHGKPVGEQGPFREVPDYLHDLNAMHEAEKILDFEQSELFEDELCEVTFKDNDGLENPLPYRFSVCHATAAQRAESFLRTIGKWTTNQNEQ
jgi:hypothetical protein